MSASIQRGRGKSFGTLFCSCAGPNIVRRIVSSSGLHGRKQILSFPAGPRKSSCGPQLLGFFRCVFCLSAAADGFSSRSISKQGFKFILDYFFIFVSTFACFSMNGADRKRKTCAHFPLSPFYLNFRWYQGNYLFKWRNLAASMVLFEALQPTKWLHLCPNVEHSFRA